MTRNKAIGERILVLSISAFIVFTGCIKQSSAATTTPKPTSSSEQTENSVQIVDGDKLLVKVGEEKKSILL